MGVCTEERGESRGDEESDASVEITKAEESKEQD